jgi:hypothetical protein
MFEFIPANNDLFSLWHHRGLGVVLDHLPRYRDRAVDEVVIVISPYDCVVLDVLIDDRFASRL